jgi:chromosome segregation ATPase
MFLGISAAIAIGIAYHYYTINSLGKEINSLTVELATAEMDLNTYAQQVTTMEEAAIINVQTIANLNNNISEQITTIQDLTTANNNIELERDQYLSIFRRHDLSELARRRPGLIQNRINSGTAEVFQGLIDTTTGVELRVEDDASL